MIKIGVDGNLLAGKKTGMGMNVSHILCNLTEDFAHSTDSEVIVYVPDNIETELSSKLIKNGLKVKKIKKRSYVQWEQITIPKYVKQDNIDILWCPYNTAPWNCPCPYVVTIYDVIYMTAKISKIPSIYKKAGAIYRRLNVPHAARKAAGIMTDSNYAAAEIRKHISGINIPIKVVYCGVDFSTETDGKNDAAVLQKFGINKSYILGFGSLEPRKNSMALIKAYNALDESLKANTQLVLFGFRGFEQSQEYNYIKENDIKDILVLGYITEEEKNILFSNSIMFVFPSLAEGFGIPVLEAFANKTPVITSNTSSLPEVAGNAALLIDPNRQDQITDAMALLISDKGKRDDLINAGLIQLQKFKWKESAKESFDYIVSHA